VAGQIRGLVELLEEAVPHVVEARDVYDARRVWRAAEQSGRS
jgi:hypothetical protein